MHTNFYSKKLIILGDILMAKKPFGGYKINFKKVADWPIEKIFGKGDLPPSEMTKKIWIFVKKNKLAGK